MNPKHLIACKLMGIDPMTGRKIKPIFTLFEKEKIFRLLKRSHPFLIKELELKDQDLLNMIDRIYGGFVNSRFYCKKYFPEKNSRQLSEIFHWIMRKLMDYK